MVTFRSSLTPTAQGALIQDALKIAQEFSTVQLLDGREKYLCGLVKIIPADGLETFSRAFSYGLASSGIQLVTVKHKARATLTPESIVDSFISNLNRFWTGKDKRRFRQLKKFLQSQSEISPNEVHRSHIAVEEAKRILDECEYLTREALGGPLVVLFYWDRVAFTLGTLHLAQILKELIRVTAFPWCILSTSWILLPFMGETPVSVQDLHEYDSNTPRARGSDSGKIQKATQPIIAPMELYDVSAQEWRGCFEIVFGTLPDSTIMLEDVWDKPMQIALYPGNTEYIIVDFSRLLDVQLFPQGTSSRPDWGKWLISWPDLDVELNLNEELSMNVKEVNLFTVQVQPKRGVTLNPHPFTVVPRKSVARLQMLGLSTGRTWACREFILVTR